jgi:hypothetical protein
MSDWASKALAERAFCQESLERTILYQNAVQSSLPSIVHKGDARKNRRSQANSICTAA